MISKILISILVVIFSLLILFHFSQKVKTTSLVEAMENSDGGYQEYTNNNELPAKNQGNIEYLKQIISELKEKVAKNTANLSKLNEGKEQVERNTKGIQSNATAIAKAQARAAGLSTSTDDIDTTNSTT